MAPLLSPVLLLFDNHVSPGKTSILCHLANVAEVNKGVVDKIETAPTVAVQMVEFRWRGVKWVAWDMSGQGECMYVCA